MALREGIKLGPYEIVAKIGEGGMGEVYLAKDSRLERSVAIKVLPDHLSRDPLALKRFQEENKKVASLSHPNIRILFDIGSWRGRTYAVMEYLQGETLAERVEKGPIPWNETFHISRAIAFGLAAAHGKGIVHRDIKPHNLFLTESEDVKILDFGLAHTQTRRRKGDDGDQATTLTQHSFSEGFAGTVAYMAPEQIRSEFADSRSDIFAFGCVQWEMLTGRRLFFRRTPVETAAAVLYDTPPPLDDYQQGVPEQLQQIILQCLEKEPEDRIQSMEDIIERLDEISKGGFRKKDVHPASVAVLPFTNMSRDKKNEYFSDGLADELINSLVKIGGLHVISRTTSSLYKDHSQDIRRVGEELNVRTVVEGSVRKSGDKLRVTAQLINSEDGYHLWSETFDREVKDVFAVQSEIAEQIAAALQVVLSEQEKQAIATAPTENIEAYDHLLQGRRHFYLFQRKSIERALSHFLHASSLDPGFAAAFAWACYCYAFLYSWFNASDTNLKEAETTSRRALALDADLAESHVARGMVLSLQRKRLEADQEFDTALRLHPDLYEASYFYARNCFSQGKYEKAARLAGQATEQRPDDFTSPYLLGMICTDLERYMDAHNAFRLSLQRAEAYLELFPDDARALSFGAGALNHLGEKQQALDWVERSFAATPEEPMTLYACACNFAMLGRADKAISCLERARLFGSLPKAWLENDPDLDSLRDRPRFQAFLAQLKNS
ncbi:MAG: protein kinase [Candidatus Aminicenantaceae bacterium]